MKQTQTRVEAQTSLLIDDAAAALGVSRRTIYYRIQQGRLETVRTRCGSQRVLWSSIEQFQRGAAGLARVAPPESYDAGEC